MTTVLARTHPPKATRLVDQVGALRATLDREGVSITDMSRAGSLEMNLDGEDPELDLTHSSGPVDIVRLEGPIAARPIATAGPGTTAFRFFLDGAQRTIPVCRIGLTPVVMAISAAGILERDESGQPRLVREALRVQQSWIAPTRLNNPALTRLLDEILSTSGVIEDPLEHHDGQPFDDYDHIAGNYGQTLSLSFKLAGRLRDRQEKRLIDQWQSSLIHANPESWLVVDGPLRGNVPNAVGLVKNLQTQQLTHNEAIALFDLPQGSRTSAFRYASSDADPGHDSSEGKTMWYMRLWSPTGMDARHSLVRIEAAHDVATTAQIDEISSWILAERLPRATADPRWPTLLYPIHYLERILKRRLSELTAGWPSA